MIIQAILRAGATAAAEAVLDAAAAAVVVAAMSQRRVAVQALAVHVD